MREIADVLNAAEAPKAERLKAHRAFLSKREQLWKRILEGRFPETYLSVGNKKFVGAPRRTAIRCDFLLASRITLGREYMKDRISHLAQRDLLFDVLRYREVFPGRTGGKFYCCPKCTEKLYECVRSKVFHYIDNDKWKAEIEAC
jgi:hypothetical protein